MLGASPVKHHQFDKKDENGFLKGEISFEKFEEQKEEKKRDHMQKIKQKFNMYSVASQASKVT